MMTTLKLTKIRQLNSIVIKQEGGHFFIAAPDSFIIDRDGLIRLLWELIKIEFIDENDIHLLEDLCKGWNEEKRKVEHENKENGSNTY